MYVANSQKKLKVVQNVAFPCNDQGKDRISPHFLAEFKLFFPGVNSVPVLDTGLTKIEVRENFEDVAVGPAQKSQTTIRERVGTTRVAVESERVDSNLHVEDLENDKKVNNLEPTPDTVDTRWVL